MSIFKVSIKEIKDQLVQQRQEQVTILEDGAVKIGEDREYRDVKMSLGIPENDPFYQLAFHRCIYQAGRMLIFFRNPTIDNFNQIIDDCPHGRINPIQFLCRDQLWQYTWIYYVIDKNPDLMLQCEYPLEIEKAIKVYNMELTWEQAASKYKKYEPDTHSNMERLCIAELFKYGATGDEKYLEQFAHYYSIYVTYVDDRSLLNLLKDIEDDEFREVVMRKWEEEQSRLRANSQSAGASNRCEI